MTFGPLSQLLWAGVSSAVAFILIGIGKTRSASCLFEWIKFSANDFRRFLFSSSCFLIFWAFSKSITWPCSITPLEISLKSTRFLKTPAACHAFVISTEVETDSSAFMMRMISLVWSDVPSWNEIELVLGELQKVEAREIKWLNLITRMRRNENNFHVIFIKQVFDVLICFSVTPKAIHD